MSRTFPANQFAGVTQYVRLFHNDRWMVSLQHIVIYGVYTEACVSREIAALIGVGPKLHIITDAVAVVGTESPTFHEKLQQQGVELITFEELKLRMLN